MKPGEQKSKQPRRAAPRATKAQPLGERPVTLRLPVDLVARVDALLPAVARDRDRHPCSAACRAPPCCAS